jgi:hypothetical protein
LVGSRAVGAVAATAGPLDDLAATAGRGASGIAGGSLHAVGTDGARRATLAARPGLTELPGRAAIAARAVLTAGSGEAELTVSTIATGTGRTGISTLPAGPAVTG